LPTTQHPVLPGPDQITLAREVREHLIRAAQTTAAIRALAHLIGYGTVTFKVQDHRIVRAVIESSEKVRAASE
jgi:hypothetical protein